MIWWSSIEDRYSVYKKVIDWMVGDFEEDDTNGKYKLITGAEATKTPLKNQKELDLLSKSSFFAYFVV